MRHIWITEAPWNGSRRLQSIHLTSTVTKIHVGLIVLNLFFIFHLHLHPIPIDCLSPLLPPLLSLFRFGLTQRYMHSSKGGARRNHQENAS
ncbi:hypothetical protein BU24DRAFT_115923 [Aaosphaeria arxii CBS 175.79]|uniref:Uncharacterized protein n=1 Tax=Aaosphaeria arxii CBS 175.79 TaxID=1450172 RepID=A0A6A5Y1C8_9PLEO|nr:uncharacterized protein BU24DRAFT_115923 [Aaosphaeria arxii CBS 175.79]KAF2019282.1 hypothetical protein BU24DRAFT_115923 [Aaosphaeria arxii CBS 175.79]